MPQWLTKLVTDLKTFQNSPVFANLAIHAWLSAFLVTAALAHGFVWWQVLLTAVALESAKEFLFDTTVESPKQTFAQAWGDLKGYLIGNVLAFTLWYFPSLIQHAL